MSPVPLLFTLKSCLFFKNSLHCCFIYWAFILQKFTACEDSLELLWMSLLHVIGFGLKVGHLLLVLCCWIVSIIYINWFISMDTKMGFLGDGGKMWLKWWEKILGSVCRIHQQYYQCIGSKKIRRKLWRKLLLTWVLGWCIVSLWIFCFMNLQVTEKRKETLASMCDERARMLQDQFNVSMNHIQAMSILISTFHHAKNPSAIDQVHLISLHSLAIKI